MYISLPTGLGQNKKRQGLGTEAKRWKVEAQMDESWRTEEKDGNRGLPDFIENGGDLTDGSDITYFGASGTLLKCICLS